MADSILDADEMTTTLDLAFTVNNERQSIFSKTGLTL